MASLLDQLYFRNPWGEENSGGLLGNFGMMNPQPMGQPQQFAGSFIPQQQPMLPPNAQPASSPPVGPPMNIMPPAQLASMQQQQQPEQPGILSRIGDAISANPTLLMALGAGTMQGGFGKGLEMGARYSILDKQQQEATFKNNLIRQQMQSTLQFMRSKGVPERDAMLMLAQPEALKAWLVQNGPVDRPPTPTNFKLGNNQDVTLMMDAKGNITPPQLPPNMQQPPAKFDDVTSLQTRYTALPQYRTYAEAAPVYQSMLETAPRNDRASDTNLAYGLAQIMSPGSVIRNENGTWAVNNIGGLPDWLQGAINRVKGEAGLNPELRRQIMTEAHGRMLQYYSQLRPEADRIAQMAKRYNIPAEDVVTPFAAPQKYEPQTPATPPATNAPAIQWERGPDGKPRKKK